MVERIFENAVILAGEELTPTRGYLRMKEGEISEISEGNPTERGVDLGGAIILPPFINAHTHVGDSVKKGIYSGKSQEEVVCEGGEKFNILDEGSEERKFESIRESLFEMKECGIQAHCDFREEGLTGSRLLNRARIEHLKSYVLSRPEPKDKLDEILEESDGFGLPSIESYQPEEIREISKRVMNEDKLLSIHVSETEKAHRESIENHDRTEVERALDFNPSFLVHGTWATEGDLRLIKESETPLVFCPRSNSLLSVGLPPIGDALEEGLEFWLGTDNLTVCSPNMFEELSFAWQILRLQSDEAGCEEAKELLKAATVNPAENLDVQSGPLREGEKTGFLILGRKRNLTNFENPHLAIVSIGRKGNIEMIYYPR